MGCILLFAFSLFEQEGGVGGHQNPKASPGVAQRCLSLLRAGSWVLNVVAQPPPWPPRPTENSVKTLWLRAAPICFIICSISLEPQLDANREGGTTPSASNCKKKHPRARWQRLCFPEIDALSLHAARRSRVAAQCTHENLKIGNRTRPGAKIELGQVIRCHRTLASAFFRKIDGFPWQMESPSKPGIAESPSTF